VKDDADTDKARQATDSGHTRAAAVIQRRVGGGGVKTSRPDASAKLAQTLHA
jgi:hypothetical protein